MKLFKVEDRQQYFEIQIERSRKKFPYCKVSIQDVLKYKAILREHVNGKRMGPVVCMGTRNGREVDLFRIALHAPDLWTRMIRVLESEKPYPHSLFPYVESFIGRSDYSKIKDDSVVGIEINPQGSRQDIVVGSFDDLPQEWTSRFGILFSNSFDHSIDPLRTAREWVRVVRPGGILIILWSDAEATETDLVGKISEKYLTELFKLQQLKISGGLSRCRYNELFLIKG